MTDKPQILNIINFIRDKEPRREPEFDLFEPVREQIKLIDRYGFRATFLVQYDTLIDPAWQEILKALDPSRYEIGVWHEIVQPLTDACKIEWHGRWSWDWHCHCGFPVGYKKAEREAMIDEFFGRFKEIFGYYPRVFGSWLFDTDTVRYACDRYGLDALCNCKEQYGTDGYTLWGGYYGQAYYPSRANAFFPAQNGFAQLDAPLFRMLGSDPVYQYDFGMSVDSGAESVQRVITLEPVYNGGGGGVPEWVDWFLKENYNGDCLTFGYAQAGQENSFGWAGMKEGLSYQFSRFAELERAGKLTIEPLGDTGRRFKREYKLTPASAITAHSAFDDDGKRSVWYSSAFYRANIYLDGGVLRIRDLHKFDERVTDPYENTVCAGNDASYETLPVADGNLFSGGGVRSGVYLVDRDGNEPSFGDMSFADKGEGRAALTFTGGGERADVELAPETLTVRRGGNFRLVNRIGRHSSHLPSVIGFDEHTLTLSYLGFEYTVTLERGRFLSPTEIESENGEVRAFFGRV